MVRMEMLEKEESERAGSLHFFERPEGDEIVADAYDFHGDDDLFFIALWLSTFREECPSPIHDSMIRGSFRTVKCQVLLTGVQRFMI